MERHGVLLSAITSWRLASNRVGQNSASSCGELVDTAGVAAAFELGGEEQVDDLLGEPDPTTRAPIDSTLASLCSRAIRAVYRQLHSAARTPRTLLAASCSPWPLPPEHDADVGIAVADLAGGGGAELRVVDAVGRVGAAVDDLVAGVGETVDQVLLEFVTGMVRSEGDPRHAGSVRAPAERIRTP